MTTPRIDQINLIDNDGNPVSAGAIIQTGINQPNWNNQNIYNSFSHVFEGRLTLSSTESVPTSAITGATALYLLPYVGTTVMIYDVVTSSWLPRILPDEGISFDLSGSDIDDVDIDPDTNYDAYVWWDGANLLLELVSWTSSTLGTTRPASVSRVPDYFEGVYVLENNPRYRYIGTIRTNSGTAITSEQSNQRLFVWNYYNRVMQTMRHRDDTGWNDFNSSTIRPFGTTSAAIEEFQMEFVLGFQSAVAAEAYTTSRKTSGSGNVSCQIAMGLDSISSGSSDVSNSGTVTTAVNNEDHNLFAHFGSAVDNGYHYINPLWSVSGSGGPLNVDFNTNDDASLITRVFG